MLGFLRADGRWRSRKSNRYLRQDAKVLLDLTQSLMDLKDALSPIPLSLVNPGEVRALLDVIAQKSLTPGEIKASMNRMFGEQMTHGNSAVDAEPVVYPAPII